MEHDHHHHHHGAAFPTGTDGLDEARSTSVVELADRSAFQLTMAPVAKRIGEDTAARRDESRRWMAHCHIAEHHESGMMLSFVVYPA